VCPRSGLSTAEMNFVVCAARLGFLKPAEGQGDLWALRKTAGAFHWYSDERTPGVDDALVAGYQRVSHILGARCSSAALSLPSIMMCVLVIRRRGDGRKVHRCSCNHQLHSDNWHGQIVSDSVVFGVLADQCRAYKITACNRA
jgi:hypothetical protein